jgi:hypothetical protein
MRSGVKSLTATMRSDRNKADAAMCCVKKSGKMATLFSYLPIAFHQSETATPAGNPPLNIREISAPFPLCYTLN